jgi:ribonuclease HI
MKEYDYTCYFDGATEKANPCEKMGVGVVIFKGDTLVNEFAEPFEQHDGTNNLSEYLGLYSILAYLSGKKGSNVKIYGDSKMVIEQMSGRWRIKDGIYTTVADLCNELLIAMENQDTIVNFEWIPREQNKRADELSKLALKLKEPINLVYEHI